MSAVPASGVRNLPHGWRWVTMGDIAEIVGGGTPRTNEPANFESGDIPWVTPADLSGYREKYISHGSRFITSLGLTSSAARLLPAGTILFSSRAPIGYVAIARNPLATNQGFKSFVLKAEVSPEYVYWWLKGSKRLAESLASGTTFLEISGANARKIPIPIAPLEQQHKIVAALEKQFSRLDDAVTNLMRVKSNLKRYRTSVLKFLYSGGSMSEELPSGWQWTTIGEQFRVEVGATPSRKHSAYWGGAIPWVSSGEVQFRRVKRTAETITEEGLRNSSTKLNPAGSVLLGMIGQGRTRGQAAILDIEAANNQNCAAIWVSKTETPPEFVYYWFMSQYEATRRVGSGNNQQALNKSLVQHLPMPWPGSIAEQRRLVAQVEERLQVVEELEAQVRANLARSQNLRRISLQRAFGQCAETGL